MSAPVFVILLVLALAAVNGVIWIPIILWVGKKRAAALGRLAQETSDSGERTVRGPERALYRGGTGNYSSVSGNGILLLTDRRLVFVKVTGGRVEVDRSLIGSVREAKVFLGSARGGRTHVVITTSVGSEIGFIVGDPQAWIGVLNASRPLTGLGTNP